MKKLLSISSLFLLMLSLTGFQLGCSRGGDGGTKSSSSEATTSTNSTTQGAQTTQTGTAGAADQGAVVNVKDIASQETLSPPVPKAPKAVHRPLPGPNR